MKTLNPNTKKAKAFIEAYNRTTMYHIHDAYTRYSASKLRADNECFNKMVRENGEHYRILSKNTFQFTCGWQIKDNLRVETKNNSYIIPNAF